MNALRLIRCEKGIFLVQAMVLLLLLAILSSMILRMNLSDHMGAVQRQRSRQGNQASLGILSRFHACVSGSDFGRTTCSMTAAQSACLPSSVDGRPVVLLVSGTAPDCAVTVKIGD